jgi:hypothetical protein
MSDIIATLMTITFCLQVIGYCALIFTQSLQRKRLVRLTVVITQLRGDVLDRCACVPTTDVADGAS